jgi:hypothetical protein
MRTIFELAFASTAVSNDLDAPDRAQSADDDSQDAVPVPRMEHVSPEFDCRDTKPPALPPQFTLQTGGLPRTSTSFRLSVMPLSSAADRGATVLPLELEYLVDWVEAYLMRRNALTPETAWPCGAAVEELLGKPPSWLAGLKLSRNRFRSAALAECIVGIAPRSGGRVNVAPNGYLYTLVVTDASDDSSDDLDRGESSSTARLAPRPPSPCIASHAPATHTAEPLSVSPSASAPPDRSADALVEATDSANRSAQESVMSAVAAYLTRRGAFAPTSAADLNGVIGTLLSPPPPWFAALQLSPQLSRGKAIGELICSLASRSGGRICLASDGRLYTARSNIVSASRKTKTTSTVVTSLRRQAVPAPTLSTPSIEHHFLLHFVLASLRHRYAFTAAAAVDVNCIVALLLDHVHSATGEAAVHLSHLPSKRDELSACIVDIARQSCGRIIVKDPTTDNVSVTAFAAEISGSSATRVVSSPVDLGAAGKAKTIVSASARSPVVSLGTANGDSSAFSTYLPPAHAFVVSKVIGILHNRGATTRVSAVDANGVLGTLMNPCASHGFAEFADQLPKSNSEMLKLLERLAAASFGSLVVAGRTLYAPVIQMNVLCRR